MSEWITDRRPTFPEADTHYAAGYVWVTLDCGSVARKLWDETYGRPWMPITPPESYVKPKRWHAEWSERHASWTVTGANYYQRDVFWHLTDREAHAEAAERIAAIYEEVMP